MKNLELEGKKFCFTGEFSDRKLFINKLESQGMQYCTEINKNLDFLFVGKNAGSRVVKSKTFDNIQIVLIKEVSLDTEKFYYLKDLSIDNLFSIALLHDIGSVEEFINNSTLGHGTDTIYFSCEHLGCIYVSDEDKDINASELFK